MAENEFNEEHKEEPMDSIATIEEINRKVNMRFLKFAIPFFAMPLSLVLLFLFPGQIPDAVFLTIFAVATGVSFVSMGVLAFASTRKSYVRTLKKLVPLSPPEPTVTEDYAVMQIEKVYVFVWRKAPYAIYFVAFNHTEPTTDSKIDVPKTFWKWDSSLHIEGLRVHNRKGRFTIPTPEGGYLSGEGYVLVLPTKGSSYMIRYPDMSRSHLRAVIEYLANLVSEEGVSSSDSEFDLSENLDDSLD